ncbi:DUF4062 domain-containing protein (plasmid) [Mycolicibacterium aichiense]|uniref:DUF4062 domain-containing protein n=1 Tax=Mycolicibacterium aichiense TaxID=1799 RepID=UPI003D66743D
MATIPVFISSTFRDFHGERDLLVGPVRQALDERLARYGFRVEIIDLRWGVAADGVDDDDRQNAVLDVCLSEIERARPFFVGLLGDRFGWIPPAHRIAFVAAEAGLVGDYSDWSVTALEFEFGAFTRPGSQAIFFRRELDGPTPDGWRDTDTARLSWFRERIEANGAQVVGYKAFSDGSRIPDLREFERLVTAVLGDALEAHARTQSRPTDPAAAAEQLFADRHTRAFCGRDGDVADVVTRIRSGRSVVISGENGVGKSALWCAAVAELRRTHRVAAIPVIRAGGVTSDATVIQRLAQLLSIPTRDMPTNFPKWWREVLASVGPVVIAVDGIDELDGVFSRRQFNAVTGLPRNVVVLTSTSLAEQVRALEIDGFHDHPLGPLPAEVVTEVATAIAGYMRRQLPAEAIASLARRPRLPVWLNLAMGEVSALNEESFRAVDPTKDPIDELRLLVTRTLGALPDDPEAIVERIAFRAERRFGGEAAEQFVQLLMTARSGLSPLELRHLTGLDELTVSGLRRAFSEVIATSPVDGRMFITDARAQAVLPRFFPITEPGAIHERLAALFRTAIDDRDDYNGNCDLIWHAVQSSGPTRAAEFLHRYEVHTEWSRPVATVLAHAYESGAPNRASLRDAGESGTTFLIHALASGVNLSSAARRRMADDVVDAAHSVSAANPGSAWAQLLELKATGMSAVLLEHAGQLAAALPLHQLAGEIGDRILAADLTELDDAEMGWQVRAGVVNAHTAAATALFHAGRHDEAGERIRRAIDLGKALWVDDGNRYGVITTVTETWIIISTIQVARGAPTGYAKRPTIG